MPEQELLIEQNEHYAVVTLNRPASMNALSPGLLSKLCSAFRELARDDAIRAAILTGAGRAFCAGLDLKAMAAKEAGFGAQGLAVTLRFHASG